MYHSLVVERIKFGPSGWNNMYPFNKGDLLVCGKLLLSRVSEGGLVPWEELRFLVGEIMYGGRICHHLVLYTEMTNEILLTIGIED